MITGFKKNLPGFPDILLTALFYELAIASGCMVNEVGARRIEVTM